MTKFENLLFLLNNYNSEFFSYILSLFLQRSIFLFMYLFLFFFFFTAEEGVDRDPQ